MKIRIFGPKTSKFGPKLAFLVNLGQAMQAYSMPCCGSVGGCGARSVSCKTPIYFIIYINDIVADLECIPYIYADDSSLLAIADNTFETTNMFKSCLFVFKLDLLLE